MSRPKLRRRGDVTRWLSLKDRWVDGITCLVVLHTRWHFDDRGDFTGDMWYLVLLPDGCLREVVL